MLDTVVYNEGTKFKFNVDAVSGTLHKSVRKSKFCLRNIEDDLCIFNSEEPYLDRKHPEEIVVLQTMLAGGNKMLVEYVTRREFDEMFDGPLPQVNVSDMIREINGKVEEDLRHKEAFEKLVGKNEEEGYAAFAWEREKLYTNAVEAIATKICEYLEGKHIGTFDTTGLTKSILY